MPAPAPASAAANMNRMTKGDTTKKGQPSRKASPGGAQDPDDEQEKGQRVKNAGEETNTLVCFHGPPERTTSLTVLSA